jgi:dihydroxyacetone kinase-like protein
MTRSISASDLRRATVRICDRLQAERAELDRLDSILGDGDCGATMASLAAVVRQESDALPDDIGEALMRIAKIMARVSGSSLAGVLIAGLVCAGGRLKGWPMVELRYLPETLRASIHRMMERGGAQLGDKTILDGLAALAEALDRGIPDGTDPATYLDDALKVTLKVFSGLPSRIGRARLAGERSIGSDDPGMRVLKYAIEALR